MSNEQDVIASVVESHDNDGQLENTEVGQDEGTNSEEGSTQDWETQAKYHQSEKDKLYAENQQLKQYEKVGKFLESRPDLVQNLMSEVGQPNNEPERVTLKSDEFDPWEAYNDPSSKSYKFRMQEMQESINNAVGQATKGIKKQASRADLSSKLSATGLSAEEVNSFMKFAQKHPSEYGLDNVIKMWRAVSNAPTQGNDANPLDKVREMQSQPQSGGVLQGQRPQTPKTDDDAIWKGVLDANRVGNKVP